ncbi:unnamed protein product [Parajaminaea phylloscopi]
MIPHHVRKLDESGDREDDRERLRRATIQRTAGGPRCRRAGQDRLARCSAESAGPAAKVVTRFEAEARVTSELVYH